MFIIELLIIMENWQQYFYKKQEWSCLLSLFADIIEH